MFVLHVKTGKEIEQFSSFPAEEEVSASACASVLVRVAMRLCIHTRALVHTRCTFILAGATALQHFLPRSEDAPGRGVCVGAQISTTSAMHDSCHCVGREAEGIA